MKSILVLIAIATTVLASDEVRLQSGEKVRFSGRVEAMLGSSFGYLPSKKGELLRLDLDELPKQQVVFTAGNIAADTSIPTPNEFEWVSVVRDNGTEGRLRAARLVSSDGAWKVTMDLVDGGSDGDFSKAWILIENRGSIVGVCQLVGELESIQTERVAAEQPTTTPRVGD